MQLSFPGFAWNPRVDLALEPRASLSWCRVRLLAISGDPPADLERVDVDPLCCWAWVGLRPLFFWSVMMTTMMKMKMKMKKKDDDDFDEK